MRKFRQALCVLLLALSPLPASLFPQDLNLAPEDLLIELRSDGGFHLFIRHKPDISSVLITETTRDPEFREANFAYRAAERNDINGDEIRLIDGIPISSESGIHSLISSTPVWHPTLGWAFHIYIPTVLYYGNEGGRHGEVTVGNGTYLNIRAFYYAHADYRGPFYDNPFVVNVSQEPERPDEANYVPQTVASFTEVAGPARTVLLSTPAEMMARIAGILREEEGAVDLVICLDVTSSMRPFFGEIRQKLVPMLRDMVADFDSIRIGMVFYKDYSDEFLNRLLPFTSDFNVLQGAIDTVRVGGGGDMPEAVDEALYAGASRFPWEAESRIMILIGDAPPHPRPRGRITREMVQAELARQDIRVHSIVLPHP
ncbi:MAG: VWA domain-containing protein [Treponema sp.]|nr:VWA domain-containing protein [Treponema sp.]